MAKFEKLGDGVERSKEYPDTFQIPDDAEKAALKKGDFVKLMFDAEPLESGRVETERMWVKIVSRDGDKFIGLLGNDPVFLKGIKYEDEVQFESRHIIGIQ